MRTTRKKAPDYCAHSQSVLASLQTAPLSARFSWCAQPSLNFRHSFRVDFEWLGNLPRPWLGVEGLLAPRVTGAPMADTLRGRSTHCKVGGLEISLVWFRSNNDSALVWTGVMRFLQTEWHRHERDRNAWEIERAEMKSRIGRLEGDVRTSKRLRESLAKHVRLLEAALKKERERIKKLGNDEKVDDMRDPKDIARESLNSVKCISISHPTTLGGGGEIICTCLLTSAFLLSSTPQAVPRLIRC